MMKAEEMTLFEAVRKRRSIRSFLPDRIDREILEQIIACAEMAPAAGNRKQTRIVVSQNQEINERIGRIHSVLAGKYRRGEKLSFTAEDVEKASSAFYGAPAVISFFGPDNFAFASQDTAILIDHIYLLAYAYGLGACMVGEVVDSFDTNYGAYLKKKWGIPEGYRCTGYILLGYPQGEYPRAPHIPSKGYAETIFED
ncbi:MAG: nitroreductase family protein [Solobacterium sp.]|nr:nitroreductase family protein [Solobacterium sp.]